MKKLATMLLSIVIIILFAPVPSSALEAWQDYDEDFEELVSEFMDQYRLSDRNFSYAYYNSATGETHMFNESKLMITGSIYKLPLAMYYYEEVEAGNISANSRFAGYSLADCYRLSLQYSYNATAIAMRSAIGTHRVFKTAIDKYTGVTAVEVGGNYLTGNNFNASMVLNILKYLHENSEFFDECLGYLKAANPGLYFKRYVSEYEIAQKYGYLLPGIATAGIIYTPTPYLLCVCTENVSNAEQVIGRFNEMVCNYTVTKHPVWDIDRAAIAIPMQSTIVISGIATVIEAYSIAGDDYFMLRDMACAIDGTNKQLEIVYEDATKAISLISSQSYTRIGCEQQPCDGIEKIAWRNIDLNISIDGISVETTAYMIDGSNYIRMHDFMSLFDIAVTYDAQTRTYEIFLPLGDEL